MSAAHEVLIDDPDALDEAVAPSGSLSSRMRERTEQLQAQRTTIIDIPGYEGILAAEYRILTWLTLRKIAQRHRKQRDEGLRELYAACDTLITACEEIHEILPSGERRATGERWLALARRAGVDLPDDASPRQALLALFRVDTRVVAHYQEYVEWQQGESHDVAEEVMQDFSPTG